MITQAKFKFEPLRQMNDVDIVFDEEVGKKEKAKRLKKVVAAGVLVLLCFLFCVGIFSTIITLSILSSERYRIPDPPEYWRSEDRINSVEFQISLNPKEDWTNRTMMLDAWIESINNYSSLIQITKEEGQEDVYRQYMLKSICGSYQDPKMRVRQFRYSETTTITLKKDEDDNSCSQPYWPAEDVYGDSKTKCEEDAHPCFNKYSYSSTVEFDENGKNFLTCAELDAIFPYAFPFMKNPEAILTGRSEAFWWKYNWKGMVGNYTHYEITFNVKYEELIWAMLGVTAIIEGEWSLRFYTDSPHHWEPEVVDDLQSLFYLLVLEWDTYEDHIRCANDFFDSPENGVLQLSDQVYK